MKTREEIDSFAENVVSRFPLCNLIGLSERERHLLNGFAVALAGELLAREMLQTTTIPLAGSRQGVVGDLIRKQQLEIDTLKNDLQKAESFITLAFLAHPNLDLDIEGIKLGF